MQSSLTDPTLQPGALAALGLRDEKRRWARVQPLDLEYYAFTARGTDRHPNEDAWWIESNGGDNDDDSGIQRFGVFDEISQKIGVASGEVLRMAVQSVAREGTSLTERLARANRAIWEHLQSRPVDAQPESQARAGVCAALIEITPSRRLRWAALGDCSIVLLRRRWWARRDAAPSAKLIYGPAEHRAALEAAVGTAAVSRVDAGTLKLHRGDALLIGSDGAALNRMTHFVKTRQPWSGIRHNNNLQHAVECHVAQVRLAQKQLDDMTLLAVLV